MYPFSLSFEASNEWLSTTFLRRPISINFVDRVHNELWLLVAMIGDGTRQLGKLKAGDTLNCVLPLGNSFTLPSQMNGKPSYLLVGGGVGMAPMLCLGARLKEMGYEPTFLLGGRTKTDILELDLFEKFGRVCITTEDGSFGEQGFVTNHSVLAEHFNRIYTCGPKPMMVAVARYAKDPQNRPTYYSTLRFLPFHRHRRGKPRRHPRQAGNR